MSTGPSPAAPTLGSRLDDRQVPHCIAAGHGHGRNRSAGDRRLGNDGRSFDPLHRRRMIDRELPTLDGTRRRGRSVGRGGEQVVHALVDRIELVVRQPEAPAFNALVDLGHFPTQIVQTLGQAGIDIDGRHDIILVAAH